jgi:arabinogalactan oligomer / maltooligosaccharide transport system permease protein
VRVLLLWLLAWFLAPSIAQADEPSAVEVRVWHATRGTERAALEKLLTEWDAAHPELTVAPLAIPYDGFKTKIEAAVPRGNGPDLFIAAHEVLGQWSRSGIVAAVPTLPDGLHPNTVEAVTYDGKVYGIPLAFKCLALFYNKALIDAPPRTTDELESLSTRFADPTQFTVAWENTPYVQAPWNHGFGGGVFQGDVVALDQPGNADALAWVADLTKRGLLPEEPTAALVTQLFNEGLAGMVVNGPWFLGEIASDIDFGVVPLPIVSATGEPARPFLTVEAAMISAHAAHPDEAIALAQFLASPEAALVRAIEGRQSVATLAAHEDPRVANDPQLAAFRAQLDATVPLPNRPEMGATWEPMARAQRRVARGTLEPEVAVRTAQKEYDIVTRPPPPEADSTLYVILAGLLSLGGFGFVVRGAWTQRAAIKKHRFAYTTVAPAALAMGILVVLPFLVGAAVSLFTHRDGTFTFVGLANFLDIVLARDWPITSPLSFWFTLLVTITWTIANVVLHVSFGVFLAMLLREPWLKLRGVYRVLLILPWAVPNYITALIWKGMFHRQFGAINGLLEAIGLEPVSWFSQFSTAFAANLVTNTWLGFPFMMVVTLGALQAIPRELEQAAEVDGATGWQRFRHVTLPLLKPALLPAVVLGSVWTFNMFNIIFLLSGGEPDGASEILISEAYRWAFTRGHRYGYASAYAVLIFLVLLGYSRLANRVLGKKVL